MMRKLPIILLLALFAFGVSCRSVTRQSQPATFQSQATPQATAQPQSTTSINGQRSDPNAAVRKKGAYVPLARQQGTPTPEPAKKGAYVPRSRKP
ncbi:MAG: hypothetical protein J2P21_22745 [Chloracidobacterium sp.]|nr:hypothetical protein [Chloracidobacterium sp.]